MPEPRPSIKIFTLDEANALLPQVKERLRALRNLRADIVAQQARVDVEEITSFGRRTPAMDALLGEISRAAEAFHQDMAALHALGCELKDLDRGLVDFYAMRSNDVVYLCWMDGEEDIAWWHPLDSGVRGRRPLNS